MFNYFVLAASGIILTLFGVIVGMWIMYRANLKARYESLYTPKSNTKK